MPPRRRTREYKFIVKWGRTYSAWQLRKRPNSRLVHTLRHKEFAWLLGAAGNAERAAKVRLHCRGAPALHSLLAQLDHQCSQKGPSRAHLPLLSQTQLTHDPQA